MTRRRTIYLALGVFGILFVFSPLFLNFSDIVYDFLFSCFVALGICLLTFDDFEQSKRRRDLIKVLVFGFILFFGASAAILGWTGRGAALIPIGIVGGGFLYWYIDKHVPAFD